MYKLTAAAYIFTHQYLNTMQQGIQSAHVVAELFISNPSGDRVLHWATKHKTLRILNAGAGEVFDDRYIRFIDICDEYDLANAYFNEPDISGLMTAFGFVMNQESIDRIETEQEDMEGLDIDPDTHPVIEFLKEMNSAR